MRGLRVGGVPFHPLLVHFPIAAWSALPFLDAAPFPGFDPNPALGRTIALFGVATGLLAMIAGTIDLIALKRAEHRDLAVRHMLLMGTAWALALFAVVMRSRGGVPIFSPVVTTLDVLTLVLLAIGGHLGGRLVHVHGTSVEGSQRPNS